MGDMMGWAGVTEEELRARGEISADFGETLSWEYLRYVREHPVRWDIPTEILYADGDHLTARQTEVSWRSGRLRAPFAGPGLSASQFTNHIEEMRKQ